MCKFRFLLLALCLMQLTWLDAQVKGKVVEISERSDTAVVPGVVVYWQNSATAATTDPDGNFTIALVAETRQLMLKALGYEDKTILIKDTAKFLLLVLKRGVDLNEVEVVYYSSGTEISYLNPIKMEILNDRSLMKAACCNLSESFETNPSIDVNFADAVTGTKQIQMLGLSGQYASITKENMPYLRGLANNYGLTFIPGTWIQSIQLGKGAGSVVNGYESFTGQINTELQNPERSDRFHFNAYGNENGRNEYNLNFRKDLNKNLATGVLSHVSFNPLLQDHNGDGFADIPAGRQYNIMNKYEVTTNKGLEAQFGGAYLKDERNGGQITGPHSHVHSDTLPLYKIGINNEKWELYSKTGYIFKKRPGTSMGLQLSYLNHEQNNFYGLNGYDALQKTFYANYIFQGIIGSTNHTYKVGSSFMRDDLHEKFQRTNYSRVEEVTGVFAEYAYNYKEKFNLVAGLRGDYHNYFGPFATPRLHLRYAFTPHSILRLSGGRALRSTNIFADNTSLMATSRIWRLETGGYNGNQNINRESGWNYGLNFTQKFKINYRDAYVTVDLYRTDFTEQTVVDIDGDAQGVTFYNLKGPSYSNTMQFEFNMEPRKRFFVKTAYRYVDTKVNYRQGLLQKALVSKHRAFVNFSYETRDKHWQLDLTTQYNGAKRLPITTSNSSEYRRAAYSPDYFNILGQLTYLTKIKTADLHVYLGVENLLNYKQPNPIVAGDVPYSKYFDASMVWGPIYGRMLYLGLRFKVK